MRQPEIVPRRVEERIHYLRGQRIILAADLAELYGVTTKRLNEQVKRNQDRFPADFVFLLSIQEVHSLRSQIATSKSGRGGQRYRPFAFTEHGAIMAANVLNSRVAIEASILVVRAFIRLREVIAEHADLKRRLGEIERRLARGFAEHEQELQEIRFLISLLEQTSPLKKSRIGF